ncbi:four-carbon acid sugar kinase family protein [[Eubacterium] cellulosolvens]
MRKQLAIIADDLTGANDTGVQFSKQGLKTIVLTKTDNIRQVSKKIDVVVVDTETRYEEPKIAYLKVHRFAKAIKKTGIQNVYKKIDSTLRGNIGTELDAVMDALNLATAIVVPAYPANRRITVGGYHLVDQMPLSLTEVSRDILKPVKESHIPTLLKGQTKREIFHIELSVVTDTSKLEKEIKKISNRGGIVVLDAVTHDNLKNIAKTLPKVGVKTLICGSAGLAEELPEVLGIVAGRPVALISGSVSHVTIDQIKKAEEALDIKVIRIDCSQILNNKYRDREMKKALKSIREYLDSGKDVIISSALTKDAKETTLIQGKRKGFSQHQISEEISTALGQLAGMVAKEKISGIILTGGAIAIKAFKTIGALGFQVKEEVMPGIPIGQIIGGRLDGLHVITKAGAFGDEDALIRCIKTLRRREGYDR